MPLLLCKTHTQIQIPRMRSRSKSTCYYSELRLRRSLQTCWTTNPFLNCFALSLPPILSLSIPQRSKLIWLFLFNSFPMKSLLFPVHIKIVYFYRANSLICVYNNFYLKFNLSSFKKRTIHRRQTPIPLPLDVDPKFPLPPPTHN